MSSALKNAVQKRLDIVADHAFRDRDPGGHLEALKQAHRELESLVGALPSDCDPRLRHFLERQSYEKALAFLKEQNV